MGKRSAILAVVIFMFGCQEVHAWFWKKAKKGTVRAVEECLKRNNSDLVSKEIIRAKCVEKNQILLPDKALDAARWRGFVLDEKKLFVIGVNYTSYIITQIDLYRKVYSAAGKFHFHFHNRKNLWIEPGGKITEPGSEVAMRVPLPYEFVQGENYRWCSDVKGEKRSCWEWGLDKVYGMKLNID